MATRRDAIRRELALRAREPFRMRIGASATATGGNSTGTTLIDTNHLVQTGDFWNEAWLYVADSTGDARLITDFNRTNDVATLEWALTNSATGSTVYEIYGRWFPVEYNDAINLAIRAGYPYYFTVTDDDSSLIVEENQMEYDISGFSPSVRQVRQVWLQRVDEAVKATATAGGNTTLTDSGQSWTVDEWANETVAIYGGTGSGQQRTISSNTATVLTVSTAWTTNPDDTSKYIIKKVSEQKRDWKRILSFRTDSMENPSDLILPREYWAYVGMTLRVVYLSDPAELTTDAGTTALPLGFIVPMAMAELHSFKVEQGPGEDAAIHQRRMQDLQEEALAYAKRTAWNPPPDTLRMETDYGDAIYPSDWPF